MSTTEQWRQRENKPPPRSESLIARFRRVRDYTRFICRPLETEDFVIQTDPFVSPPKWHLAHTTWFFEQFLLKRFKSHYKEFHPEYSYLFNSYYQSFGAFNLRARRGVLCRPVLDEVWRYRASVESSLLELLEEKSSSDDIEEIRSLVEIGLAHEEQHQELLLMDVLHIFASNPLQPAYSRTPFKRSDESQRPLTWKAVDGGLVSIGQTRGVFGFDNEFPRHSVYVEPFKLATRLVTNGEFAEFVDSGAYQNPALWLSDGWDEVGANNWESPLYWFKRDGDWWEMTLSGPEVLDRGKPVSHVSFYEAEAFAGWSGKRLPTEAEWEVAFPNLPGALNALETEEYRPREASRTQGLQQGYGELWQWTSSAYGAYPGYKAPSGPLGEYNGKFMVNQMVLKGSSFATPKDHSRPTYRNFYSPNMRWQFCGIRLASEY